MITGFIYVIILLLIFFMLFCFIYGTYLYLPPKLKIISYVIIGFSFLRIVTLVIFLSVVNLSYLYIFKTFYYLNYIYIFGICMFLYYIFLRSSKFKLLYVYFCLIGALILNIIMFQINSQISIYNGLCYSVYPDNRILTGLIYSLAAFITTVIFIKSSTRKNINHTGMVLIITASCAFLIENIMQILNIYIMPSYIFSDFLCMAAFLYGINCFRKQYKFKL